MMQGGESGVSGRRGGQKWRKMRPKFAKRQVDASIQGRLPAQLLQISRVYTNRLKFGSHFDQEMLRDYLKCAP